MGTAAIGSLIITIHRLLQVLINAVKRKPKESDDVTAGTITECFSCCCKSLVEIIESLNQNAYVMTAVHGTDFFTSAKDAFNLIMRNIVKVAVTTTVRIIFK